MKKSVKNYALKLLISLLLAGILAIPKNITQLSSYSSHISLNITDLGDKFYG